MRERKRHHRKEGGASEKKGKNEEEEKIFERVRDFGVNWERILENLGKKVRNRLKLGFNRA